MSESELDLANKEIAENLIVIQKVKMLLTDVLNNDIFYMTEGFDSYCEYMDVSDSKKATLFTIQLYSFHEQMLEIWGIIRDYEKSKYKDD